MPFQPSYDSPEPARDEVDQWPGMSVLEFGIDWCGFCQAAQPPIEAAFAAHPEVRHTKVADGPGRPLGRSFRIKLWPTLVFLRDGVEVTRVVRPENEDAIRRGLESLMAGTG